MPKFRKLPVEVEAIRWEGFVDGTHTCKVPWPKGWPVDLLGDTWCDGVHWLMIWSLESATLPMREYTMYAKAGDWIIRGTNGELYPCKPDVFAATYEEV